MAGVDINPHVLVFDLDDTLYLEQDYVFSGFKAVGRYMASNMEIYDFESVCLEFFKKGFRGNIFDLALATYKKKINTELIRKLIQVYRDHKPNIKLENIVYETLVDLKKKYALAIVTGGPLVSQKHKVEALGLNELVDLVVYAGKYGPKLDKPHPWAWKYIETRVSYSGKQLVYFGDNPKKDFDSPLNLGWIAVRLRKETSEHFQEPTPRGVYEFNDLVSAVNELGF
jgi:putative hydrolase of the HAD superfamily